ncbi:hypothetical protein BT67DRAFT_264571 [Trichocladium antarcticum]|uniref:Uncharacterized protein n=1 Tax=Trichocladium antarcticum TaxID=1450529 RepID=A0AAN6UNR0_9PEZI|nr:hypothetical protein BT67DRAFT_264571 [Trichocladium antarcticum]
MGAGDWIFWYWPETNERRLLTLEEYQQFLTIYPRNGQVAYEDTQSITSSDLIFDAECAESPERAKNAEIAECAEMAEGSESGESTESSEFILDPDAELIEDNTEYYDLPPRPDTPTPPSPPKKAASLPDRFYTPAPSPEPETLEPPTSPYRRRATSFSWTGLEETAWGVHNFVDRGTGLLVVQSVREAEERYLDGILHHCAWNGYASPEHAPVSAGPELVLTTDEGENYWLDDNITQYEYDYVYDQHDDEFFGHCCDELCGPYYYDDENECAIEDDEEDYDEGHARAAGEAEAEMDDVHDMLGRIEMAVHGEVGSRKQEQAPVQDRALPEVPATKNTIPGLPFGTRDPTLPKKSWADMMDEEDEEDYPTPQKKSWADIMDEEDEEY